MPGEWWERLSSRELVARLTQRGMAPALAVELVADRDRDERAAATIRETLEA